MIIEKNNHCKFVVFGADDGRPKFPYVVKRYCSTGLVRV